MTATLAGIALVFWMGATNMQGREPSALFRYSWIALSLLLLALFLWVQRHFVFHRGRAVWIENGQVHWMLGSRAITDIKSVELDTRIIRWPLVYTAILLKYGDCGEDDIRATFLSEPAETVAQRLRDMLDIPKPESPGSGQQCQ
jgi:hypothetical protein